MIAQTLAEQKKKKKTLEQQIPKEFREDCKVFSIDFDKLQPKVDKVFDKWIGRENPKTKQPYTEKTVAKWIRFMMKEAGYAFKTIWQVLKENHPDVIQQQNHKRFTKSKPSSVTTEQEQDIIWQIDPKDYNPDDWDKYDPAMQERIFRYLDKAYMRAMQTGIAEASKLEDVQAENKKLKAELARFQKGADKR